MRKESDQKAPFLVLSEHFRQPCHEKFDDTVAASAPEIIFAPDGAIIVKLLEFYLRKILKQTSEQLNEHWHHAEFFVTDDPDVVTEAIDDHCPQCISGSDQSMTYLRENPGKKMIVGRIWWVPQK